MFCRSVKNTEEVNMRSESFDLHGEENGQLDAWPTEVDFILSVLETASFPEADARMGGRTRYHATAELEIQGELPATLYTRDISAISLGFITRSALPVRFGAVVRLFTPGDGPREIPCTVFRCRPLAPGWYEGAVFFNARQENLPTETQAANFVAHC
jgi:hypothetical protein